MNHPLLLSNLNSRRVRAPKPASQELSVFWTPQKQRWARDRVLRALLFAIGFSPITSLSLSTFDLIPLHLSGPMIVAPAILLVLLIATLDPQWRRRIATGFLLGVAAVTLYDLTRLPFVTSGLWADFIPKIGNYLLDRGDVCVRVPISGRAPTDST